jgi:F-type H+-transporting ATPase subunit b
MNFLILASGAAGGSITDVKPGLIFWTLITFFIVAFVLRRMAWTPILKAVDEREKQIAGAIDSAKRERAEAEKLLAEQKTAIADARREAADQLRKNQADMDKFREELMSKARADADAHKKDAERSIEEAKAKASAELRSEAVTLSIRIAEKLLAEKLDDAKHRQLAEQFVADLSKNASQPRA